MNLTVCVLSATIETMCTPGGACAAGVDAFESCDVSGTGVALVRRVAGHVFANAGLVLRCVDAFPPADACELAVGRLHSDVLYATPGWRPSVAYDVDRTGMMHRVLTALSPWAFLSPFDACLWALVGVLVVVVTPLASSIIEYDRGETFAGNFKMYLVESVHAYTGVDTLFRWGDSHSKDSGFLSAIVSVVSKVLLSIYGCNLAAFVLVSYFEPARVYQGGKFSTIASARPFAAISNVAESVVACASDDQALAAFRNGSVPALVASIGFLQTKQACGDEINEIPGPMGFVSLGYAAAFAQGPAFDAGLKADALYGSMTTLTQPSYTCPATIDAVGLGATFGLFAIFAACVVAIAAIALAVHKMRREIEQRASRFTLTEDHMSQPPAVQASTMLSSSSVNFDQSINGVLATRSSYTSSEHST